MQSQRLRPGFTAVVLLLTYFASDSGGRGCAVERLAWGDSCRDRCPSCNCPPRPCRRCPKPPCECGARDLCRTGCQVADWKNGALSRLNNLAEDRKRDAQAAYDDENTRVVQPAIAGARSAVDDAVRAAKKSIDEGITLACGCVGTLVRRGAEVEPASLAAELQSLVAQVRGINPAARVAADVQSSSQSFDQALTDAKDAISRQLGQLRSSVSGYTDARALERFASGDFGGLDIDALRRAVEDGKSAMRSRAAELVRALDATKTKLASAVSTPVAAATAVVCRRPQTALVACIHGGAPESGIFDGTFAARAAVDMKAYQQYYDTSRIIERCSFEALVEELRRLRDLRGASGTASEVRVDLALLAQGDANRLFLANGPVTRQRVAQLASEHVRLGAVFLLGDEGAALSKAWLDAGARAVAGAKSGNEALAAYNDFFAAWTKDVASFGDAVAGVNDDARGYEDLLAADLPLVSTFGLDKCCYDDRAPSRLAPRAPERERRAPDGRDRTPIGERMRSADGCVQLGNECRAQMEQSRPGLAALSCGYFLRSRGSYSKSFEAAGDSALRLHTGLWTTPGRDIASKLDASEGTLRSACSGALSRIEVATAELRTAAEAALNRAAEALLTDVRRQARARLEQLQTEVDAWRRQQEATLVSSTSPATVEATVRAAWDEYVALRMRAQSGDRIAAVASCLGRQVPQSIGNVLVRMAGWRPSTGQAAVAAAVVRRWNEKGAIIRAQLERDANRVLQPARALQNDRRVEAAVRAGLLGMRESIGRMAAAADVAALRRIIQGDRSALDAAKAAGIALIDHAAANGRQVLGQVKRAMFQRPADLELELRTMAVDTVREHVDGDFIAAVPEARDLPRFVREALGDNGWVDGWACLCKEVAAVAAGVGNAAGRGASATEESIFTDAVCAVPLFMKTVADGAAKLRQLKEMRRQSPPVATGYDPSAARSPAVRAKLAEKARTYEEWLRKYHLYDHQIVECVEVSIPPDPAAPGALNVRRACKGANRMTNAGGYTGRYMTALAYKYHVTQDPAVLAALKGMLAGFYNISTIASAPNCGTLHQRSIVHPDRKIVPHPGLPVRFYHDANGLFADDHFFEPDPNDKTGSDVYEFRGKLEGLVARRFYFMERQSLDDSPQLFIGALAAHDVFKAHNIEPEWRRKIAEVAVAFGEYFVKSGLRVLSMEDERVRNSKSHEDSPYEIHIALPTELAFLKAAIHLGKEEGLPETELKPIRDKYDQLVKQYLGGGKDPKKTIFWNVSSLFASGVLTELGDVMDLFLETFTKTHVVNAMYILSRYERDPDLAALYRWITKAFVIPWAEANRVPMYDLMFAAILGSDQTTSSGERFSDRAAAVLAQFRDRPIPFGNPVATSRNPLDKASYYTDYRSRLDLQNPLYVHAQRFWREELPKSYPNLFKALAGQGRGVEEGKFKDGLGSAWPLGGRLVQKPAGEENPYWLRGGSNENDDDPFGVWHAAGGRAPVAAPLPPSGRGRLRRPPVAPPPETVDLHSGDDFVAAYWFARYAKLLQP